MPDVSTISALASCFRLDTGRSHQELTTFLCNLFILAINTALLITLEFSDLRFKAGQSMVSFTPFRIWERSLLFRPFLVCFGISRWSKRHCRQIHGLQLLLLAQISGNNDLITDDFIFDNAVFL